MNAYNSVDFDERRLFSDGTPDRKNDSWVSLDDYGWTELELGSIVAARFQDGWRVGYVQSMTKSIDDWTCAIRIPYRIDGKPSDDGYDEFVARHDDVFVPKAMLAIDRTRPVPEVVCAVGVKVAAEGFLCRSIDNPTSFKVVPFGDAEILFPKGSRQTQMEERDMEIYARVFRFKNDDGYFKAMAEVTLDDRLVLKGLRIVDGENGLFVEYPNDPFYKGEEYRAIYFPCERKLRDRIEKTVLDRYWESLR